MVNSKTALENIRIIAREKNITFRKLSELIGVKEANVSLVMNGKRKLTVEFLSAVATALEVSLQELFKPINQEEDLSPNYACECGSTLLRYYVLSQWDYGANGWDCGDTVHPADCMACGATEGFKQITN